MAPGTRSAGPYRAVEAGEIMDSYGDRLVLRRYGSVVKSSRYSEQSDAVRSLFDDFPSPELFRRDVETRTGLMTMQVVSDWILPDALKNVSHIVVEAPIKSDRIVRDLLLLQRTLNVSSDVDDEMETLRRAVIQDTRTLVRSGAASSHARFWICIRSARADSLSITLFSKGAIYTDEMVSRACAGIGPWLQDHFIAARVTECQALSARDTLIVRLSGPLAIRVEMLPILSNSDGRLVVPSDPRVDAVEVFRWSR
jgi:hypothetical protein